MVERQKETDPVDDDDTLDEFHRRLQVSDAANLTAEPGTPSAWERVKLARHPNRPYTLDYIQLLFGNFCEIHGDRRFGDDPAMVAGFAQFHDEPCVVIGHQKGRTTKQRQHRNFGMPKPEGYRKALRVMKLAEKFRRPVFTLIDTPGAYPGIDAEERGQAEAIAYNLREMAKLRVPVIVAVTGEGGSGGALAIGMSAPGTTFEASDGASDPVGAVGTLVMTTVMPSSVAPNSKAENPAGRRMQPCEAG